MDINIHLYIIHSLQVIFLLSPITKNIAIYIDDSLILVTGIVVFFHQAGHLRWDYHHGHRRVANLGGAVHFWSKISNRVAEQAEKLPEFPIVLYENLPK